MKVVLQTDAITEEELEICVGLTLCVLYTQGAAQMEWRLESCVLSIKCEWRFLIVSRFSPSLPSDTITSRGAGSWFIYTRTHGMFTTISVFAHLLCDGGTSSDYRTYDINIPLHYRWINIILQTLWTLCSTIRRRSFVFTGCCSTADITYFGGPYDTGGHSPYFPYPKTVSAVTHIHADLTRSLQSRYDPRYL